VTHPCVGVCCALIVAWQGNSSDALAKTKNEYDAFLADKDNLHKVREQLKVGSSWGT
jgi:hypothetical protein